MTDILTVLDFPGIKQFVFGTNPVREIRGASALLELLNKEKIPRFLEDRLEKRYQPIFMGGGAGAFLVTNATLQEIEDLMADVDSIVHRETGNGIDIVWSSVEQTGAFNDAFRRAHILLGQRKGRLRKAKPRTGSALLRECDSCSAAGVTKIWNDEGDNPEWICSQCWTKREYRDKSPTWDQLREKLASGSSFVRPKDFHQLGLKSMRQGYVALVYIDGDSMGRLIRRIESPKQYRLFSDVVDSSLREAAADAVKSYALSARKERGDTVSCDILLLGGDDLVMVVPADLALPMSISICRSFQRLTKKQFSKQDFFDKPTCENGLTVSAGIAIFKDRQPFRVVFDQAEDLLKSAKQRRSEDSSLEPYIDFADVSQTRFVKLQDLRRAEQGVGTGVELTFWPMSLTRSARFLDTAVELVKSGVATSRIHAIGAVVEKERNVAFDTMRIIARAKNKERDSINHFLMENEMWPHIPWRLKKNVRSTGLLDLAVLYPHIAKKETRNATV